MLKNFFEKMKERREERHREFDELMDSLNEMKQEYMNARKREEEYVKMSSDEIVALPEDELYDMAFARTEHIVEQYPKLTDAVKALNPVQRTFYVSNYYEMEVNNGGLCQFFVNSSSDVAPWLCEALDAIGAKDHRELFQKFVTDEQIDLTDLSSFKIRRSRDFEKQTKRYPFDEFDDAFYEMEAVSDYLMKYVKENIDAF